MNATELPQDIQDAIGALTDALLANSQAKSYLQAVAALESDPEASTLARRFMDLYNHLVTRQQNGEQLSQQEIEPFYTLRSEYHANPLVAARNDTIGAFKPLLAEAGEQISIQIGLDFTELAKPQ